MVFGHEAFTLERVLVRLARNRKIRTVALLHGGLGTRASYRGIVGEADTVLVWNDYDLEMLAKYGVEACRLRKVGCLQYESRYRSLSASGDGADTRREVSGRQSIGLPGIGPVVAIITAAINCDLAAPVSDPAIHRQALEDLISLARRRKDLTFILRPHPSFDYPQLYQRLVGEGLRNLHMVRHMTLADLLKSAFVCVAVNYCTTAILEAMMERVPVVYIQNAVYAIAGWEDSLPERALIRVDSVSKAELHFDRLLADDEYRRKVVKAGFAAVERLLDVGEKTADERVREAIHDAAGESPAAIRDVPNTSAAYAGYAEGYLCGFESSGARSMLASRDESGGNDRDLMIRGYMMGYRRRQAGALSAIRLLSLLAVFPRMAIRSPLQFRKIMGTYLLGPALGYGRAIVRKYLQVSTAVRKLVRTGRAR